MASGQYWIGPFDRKLSVAGGWRQHLALNRRFLAAGGRRDLVGDAGHSLGLEPGLAGRLVPGLAGDAVGEDEQLADGLLKREAGLIEVRAADGDGDNLEQVSAGDHAAFAQNDGAHDGGQVLAERAAAVAPGDQGGDVVR